MNIARVKKVNIRDVWKFEDKNFTPWLAKQENIDILGEELDLNLEIVGIEEKVGNFRVDILCIDADSDNTSEPDNIIIENQYGKTDHDHLGKLITYGSGLEARVIIWIVENARPEHRTAISWLNDQMPKIDFYLVAIEVWQIGDSAFGPKFNVLIQPDEFIRDKRKFNPQFNETQKMRYDFWIMFKEWINKNYPNWTPSNYQTERTYYGVKLSDKVDYLNARIDVKDKYISAAYYSPVVDGDPIKFDHLMKNKNKIEEEIRGKMTWDQFTPRSRNKWSLIQIVNEIEVTRESQNKWPDLFKWLADNLEKLDSVLKKYL